MDPQLRPLAMGLTAMVGGLILILLLLNVVGPFLARHGIDF